MSVRRTRRASGIYPALALLPAADVAVEDVWHTDGMRATGSNDVVVTDAFVPEHRLVRVTDIYGGTAPGAELHDCPTYRWPMVPALGLLAAMPALGSAERVTELYADRLARAGAGLRGRHAEGQTDRPSPPRRGPGAATRPAGPARRHRWRDRDHLAAGDVVPRPVRGDARLAAAHIVHESRAVIAALTEASGASAHFVDNPLQRFKRDVDVISGHVVFDYDTSRELAGALTMGMKIPRTAMV